MNLKLEKFINKNLKESEKKQLEEELYIDFCVEYVNEVRKNFDLKKEESTASIDSEKIIVSYSLELPSPKIVNTCRRKYMKINQENGTPYTHIPGQWDSEQNKKEKEKEKEKIKKESEEK